MYRISRRPFAVLLPVVLAVFLVPGFAQEPDPEAVIKYRTNAMKALSGHMGAMRQIVGGHVPFSEHLLFHARAAHALAGSIRSLFPEGSDFGITDAKDEIWSQPVEFEEAAAAAAEQAGALLAAVEEGDKGATGLRFKELEDGCKACHRKFREE